MILKMIMVGFLSEFEGQEVLVKYAIHDDKIIIGMVSYNEIYKRRNTVVKWLMFVIPVTSAVITLTIRDKILKTANKDNKI